MMWGKSSVGFIVGLLGLVGFSGEDLTDINLEFRPKEQQVLVGQSVSIRYYAVSDDEDNQPISSISAILSWDPEYLELVGRIDNGPYVWVGGASFFPSGGDGLNDTWLDGDAFWMAWMVPAQPAQATPDGLLVTTFRFVALAETPLTVLTLIPEYGQFSHTRVLSGVKAGQDVTGRRGAATFGILPCGWLGDLDGDCDVDTVDLAELEVCLAGPDGGLIEPECQAADLDGSGHVDLGDVRVLQASFTGP